MVKCSLYHGVWHVSHKTVMDIVFLVLDTQRADRLSCYGYPRPTSPHLDALAARATRYTQAIAAAQWTLPSHASMFTGLYPSAHGLVQSYSALPASIPTLAERLQAGGYYTAGFCNNPLVGVINNGLRRGFQSFLNYSGLMNAKPNQAAAGSGWLDRYRQGFKRWLATGLQKVQDAFARSEWLLALSFTPLMVPLWQTALSFKGNTAKSLADAAELLIARQGVAPEQPIFTFINLMGTHMPYHPPRRFTEQFAPEVLKTKSAQRFLGQFNSDIYGWLAPLARDLDPEQKQVLDGMYDAEVAAQDEQVGIFIERLRASGALDTTLIVVCADHGEHLGEKQFIGHTLTVYNELVRVPLLIYNPHQPQGQVVEAAISTRRLFHTVLTAAGLATEAEQALSLTAPQTDPWVLSEAVPPQNVVNLLRQRRPDLIRDRDCDKPRRAVWSRHHKLIESGDATLELYSLDDPSESLDLSAMLPEHVEALQAHLQAMLTPIASSGDYASNFDDPEVQQRLRDLGYLED